MKFGLRVFRTEATMAAAPATSRAAAAAVAARAAWAACLALAACASACSLVISKQGRKFKNLSPLKIEKGHETLIFI
jgi:hypothetical protein